MTVNAILTSSNILDNKINHDLLTLKEKLQHTVHSQKFNVSVTTTYAEIKILLKNTIDNNEIIEKSRKLEQVSNLCSQKGKLIKTQYENEYVEFVEQIDYLRKLAAFYAKIYEATNFILAAENESYLIDKFHRYTLGYEIFAIIIEKGKYLSPDIYNVIETAVNATLQIELEERNKEENIQIPDFSRTALILRSTLMSILWSLEKLKEEGKNDGYKTSVNSPAPSSKPIKRTSEDRLRKKLSEMRRLRNCIDEEIIPENAIEREINFEILKRLEDKERQSWHKIYSEEQ